MEYLDKDHQEATYKHPDTVSHKRLFSCLCIILYYGKDLLELHLKPNSSSALHSKR